MLEKKSWTVPASFEFADSEVVPFFAGESLSWRLLTEQP
jgi:dihydroorotase